MMLKGIRIPRKLKRLRRKDIKKLLRKYSAKLREEKKLKERLEIIKKKPLPDNFYRGFSSPECFTGFGYVTSTSVPEGTVVSRGLNIDCTLEKKYKSEEELKKEKEEQEKLKKEQEKSKKKR